MHINMQTHQTNPTCKGLFKYLGTIEKKNGRSSINKRAFFIHKFDYYPYENETAETIKKTIDKYTIGRSFSLWERDHGHVEGTYYALNQINIKNAIKKGDKDYSEELNFFEKPYGGVMEYNDFIATYNNAAYGTMDVIEFNKDRVDKIIQLEDLH